MRENERLQTNRMKVLATLRRESGFLLSHDPIAVSLCNNMLEACIPISRLINTLKSTAASQGKTERVE